MHIRPTMALCAAAMLGSILSPTSARAAPLPDRATLAASAARRFPQPVRVGSLVGRDVLQPTEAQPVLGHVEAITRRPDGTLDLVMRYGGVAGIGGRLIAVPLDAAALLGEYVSIVGLTPGQLDTLPTVPAPADPMPPEAMVTMGLVRPFH